MLIQTAIEYALDIEIDSPDQYLKELDEINNILSAEREHKRQLEELEIDEKVYPLNTTI